MAITLLRFDMRAPAFSPASTAELYAAALEMGAWADERGFDSLTLSEHHGADDGFLRTILGEPGDTSLSFGWARAFERHGMSDFTGVFGNNPGLTVNANRNTGNGNLGPVPLLLRDSSSLGPPPPCTGSAMRVATSPEVVVAMTSRRSSAQASMKPA